MRAPGRKPAPGLPAQQPRQVSHLGGAKLFFQPKDLVFVLLFVLLQLLYLLLLQEHLLFELLVLHAELPSAGKLSFKLTHALLQVVDSLNVMLAEGQRLLIMLFHLWAEGLK